MSEENVKVAVRVRPFNSREKTRNASLIVQMNGPTTTLTDPEEPNGDPRKFTFDYSYWSHDGFKEEPNGYFGSDPKHANGRMFCDQKKVFNDLGVGILKNAWEGYNSTLFAYGQTGSGKSWSIVGYGINRGIVPQFCELLFNEIGEKKGDGTEYEVTFSMLEIYNENVRDLLDSSQKQKSGLKVRQHPKRGFYAEGLKTTPVDSYESIENKMEEGTTNRTVAATNMNATSSRAHTIVGITFIQKFKNSAGEDTTKSSVVNLVDLAGSERASSTGATGDRLKEGAAINTSLSALGNCIAALADQSSGQKVRVPFRDSVLTKLLKNALGGNSKTIMVAAISPADINFDESLSTLRYADRAKQIKTSATVNEDPTEKLIRTLQEENDRLKKLLEGGQLPSKMDDDDDDDDDLSPEEREKIRKEIEDDYKAMVANSQQEMENLRKEFARQLEEARAESNVQQNKQMEINQKKKSVQHMYNINFDPQLSGRIVHFFDCPMKKVGNQRGEPSDIELRGPSILADHAVVTVEGKNVFLTKASNAARVLINGDDCDEKTQLQHNDRLMFGTTQMFVFHDPTSPAAKTSGAAAVISFESFQEEIASKSGFDMQTENKGKEEMLLQEDLMEMLPAVEEANSISEELDKHMKFEVMVVSPEARGVFKGRPSIFVRALELETQYEWIWSREKFLNRKYVMQELFEKYQEDEDYSVPPDRDPFCESYDHEVPIGSVKIWTEPLVYLLDIDQQLDIVDYSGKSVGLLNVKVVPSDAAGRELKEEDILENSMGATQLVNRDLHFVLHLISARGLPNKYNSIYCKYMVFDEETFGTTDKVDGTSNPDWKFKRVFHYPKLTATVANTIEKGLIIVQVWGRQKPPKKVKKAKSTQEEMRILANQKGAIAAANTNTKQVDTETVKQKMVALLAQKREERLQQKIEWFQRFLSECDTQRKARVSVALIKELLQATTNEKADRIIKQIKYEPDAVTGDVESVACSVL